MICYICTHRNLWRCMYFYLCVAFFVIPVCFLVFVRRQTHVARSITISQTKQPDFHDSQKWEDGPILDLFPLQPPPSHGSGGSFEGGDGRAEADEAQACGSIWKKTLWRVCCFPIFRHGITTDLMALKTRGLCSRCGTKGGSHTQ